MPTIWTLLRVTAVVMGSSAALLTGGIAHADTGQPAPVPNIGQQLANTAATAPQLLQNLTSALGGAPAKPPTPPPLASADIKVPQPLPASVPGAMAVPPAATSALPGTSSAVPGITSVLPGAAPAMPSALLGTSVATPATGPGQLVPTAQVALPNVPLLPVPLPQELSFPGDLASLAPGAVPIPRGIAQPSTPAASTGSAAAAVTNNPLLLPLSGLP